MLTIFIHVLQSLLKICVKLYPVNIFSKWKWGIIVSLLLFPSQPCPHFTDHKLLHKIVNGQQRQPVTNINGPDSLSSAKYLFVTHLTYNIPTKEDYIMLTVSVWRIYTKHFFTFVFFSEIGKIKKYAQPKMVKDYTLAFF